MAAAIVFAAAPLTSTPRLRARLLELDSPFIVAADAGAATARSFGLSPNVVIGDFDSLDASTLRELRQAGIPIETHPRDKNETDGQLAIDRALREQPDELILLGFLGGPRLDQALANVLVLTRINIPAVLLDERNECRLLRGPAEQAWDAEPSEIVSLIALTEVDGVDTDGLRWPLNRERLHLGDTRSISNEPNAPRARVRLTHGLLLVTRHFV